MLKTEGDEEPAPYAASSHKIHSIGLADSSFICASDSERFLNVFAIEEGLTGTLRADADVSSISLYSYPRSIPSEEPGRILSVVNKDGLMEIFQEPFQFSAAGMMGQNLSRKARLSQKSKRSSATLRVRRPDKATSVVPLLDASMRSEFIYLAWAEGGLDVKFEKIRWRASGSYELLLSGSEELVKAESMSGQVNATVNGVKQIGKTYVDESRAVVGDGETIGDVDAPIDRIDSAAAIEISSAEDSESSFESDSEPEPKSSRTTAVEEDVQKEDPDAGALTRKKDDIEEQVVADPVDLAEATFGDLLRAREPALVNVQATFPDPTQQAVARVGAPGSQSSGLSLGLVLSQSLRTNDVSMLESCLHNTDLATIRTTVERLDSSLALVLCQRLAERIHSRPGRAGNLVTWIESIIIAHGGYLVGQPHLMRSIRSLVRVLRERTSALQTFLTMKGKLDIIAAQVNHRRSALERSRAKNALEEDDEEAVIYVEGQDDSSSEDEAGGYEDLTRTSDNDFEPFDDDEDVQMDDEGETVRRLTNGDLSANEDSSDEDEGDGLIDDEAESTDAESDSDLDGDIDDGSVEDSESLASDDEDEAPPAKRPATERLTNGIPHRHS